MTLKHNPLDSRMVAINVMDVRCISRGGDSGRKGVAKAHLQATLQELLGLLAANRDVARDLLVTAHAPLADRQAALRVHLPRG